MLAVKLVLLFGMFVASWMVDAAAIQNTANLSAKQTTAGYAEAVVEIATKTNKEENKEDIAVGTTEKRIKKIMEETTKETTEETPEEKTKEKTEETIEEVTEETIEEKTEEKTEETTEETTEGLSLDTENDPIPASKLEEQPVQFQ